MSKGTVSKNKTSRKLKEVKIFVISGPGGVGKTTLVKHLFKNKDVRDAFIRGISVTTRRKRPYEKEAEDYFFVTSEEFSRLKKQDFFLESQKVLNQEYGTPNLFYLLARKKNKGLILCIDVKGGMYLKKKVKAGRIVTVFVGAPTKEELYRRMKDRAETKSIMKEKVKLAKEELKVSSNYDFLIINKDLKMAVKELQKIVSVNSN
ncbi:MAG: guanylate kinase [Omnitrophica bacterium]|nr:guanylate kinase [Candidatus Omnitrophota bacterium]